MAEVLPSAWQEFREWISQRKAGTGGGTALVPASSAPEPVGMEEPLPMPEEEYYEAFEKGFNYDEDEFIDPLDTGKEADILIGRSVGAKAANYVAGSIISRSKGRNFKDYAILYRTNAQSNAQLSI